MENIKKRRMLDILIFFAVTVCLLAVFMPIYKALETRLIYVRDSLISKIEKEYGITIKYGSMSPSLVSKIMIKDVNLYDDKTGDKIAHFSLIHFNYRISEVIKRNPAAVISSIGIYDGVIDFNISKNKNLWGRINGGQTESGLENKTEKSADGSDGDSGKTDSQSLARRIEDTITKFQNNIETSDITLRNILINYAAGPIKSELYISDGKIHVAKEKTEFNLNSKLRYLNPSFQNFSDFKTDLDISGSFYQNNLSASSIINFSNIKNGTVSIPKISIFASYLNNIVSVMTLQDIHPIDIKGSWNTERNSGSLNIECKDLQPIAIAFPNERNSVLSDLKTSEVSGFLNLSMSEKKEFSWNTNLYVKFPSFKINNGNTGTTVITLDALGDHNVIQINSFSADGENINARLSGSYKIKEVLPDFKIDVVKLKPPQMEALSFKLNIASNLKNIFADVPYLKFGEAEFNSVKTVFEKKENKTDFIFSYDDVPGKFTIDGTWIHPEKDSENKFGYLELHGAADSIGVKNIYDATQAFFEGHSEEEAAIKKFIVPLKLTSEFYISSDFKKFSYNVIQTVLASSEDDGFYALFSLTGNESSAEVGGIDVSLNKLHLTGSVNSSFENGGIVFDSLLALNDVAYKIAGLYENDTLNIYGDYGLNIHIFKSENNDLNGNFQVRELPIPFLNSVFSAEMIFDYVNAKKWDLTCNFAKLEHLKSNISKTDENFEFEIAGTANPNQVFFHTVKVGRKKSQLEGTASLSLSSGSESNLKTYAANIFVTDSDKKEKIIFDSSFSFSDTIYFDGNCSIENVSLNRFFANQKQENKINVETVFLGSPDALLIKADLKDFNYNLNGKPLTGKLTAVLDDKQIIVNDTHFS